ncbi:structural maintenance of chromosomes protein 6B-like isoform X2 [Mercurialis annua]|uniref:structural maintenance of chromosomes protein 6B-like isoform X2 n=1 Tax=Mercurialis annua TaxID=3986 RepID=UPI002160EE8A|nr:structural maintenance of chromosomes protein 6B-like isoform X2 [Mercurialis annua]
MGDATGFSDFHHIRPRSGAGTITRIRLENFMCHSNLQIELCPWVNFVTGQNGSGKSAILTALCIAFGSRAKGTQRAATLKDFIKTGCSYTVVEVELKNQGDEAFKHEIYGDAIIIERRINQSTSSTILKDFQGKKVASRKDELRELIEHFNIDVENPCVIMSQDKSREFLHSGNDKDKFKFFFKATLLQQVNDLLQSIYEQLQSTNALVDELEATIKPIEKELVELQIQIKNMEHIEEISLKVQQLKKMLAWSWVYSVDRQIEDQTALIEDLKTRIPICQKKIDAKIKSIESLRNEFTESKAKTVVMMQKTSEVRRKQDESQHLISLATKRVLELKDEHRRAINSIQKMQKDIRSLEQEVQDIQDQQFKTTQAEESEIEAKLKELECMIDAAEAKLSRSKKDESQLSESVFMQVAKMNEITEEIASFEKKEHEMRTTIRQLRQHKTNKVTAFGGERVIQLLQIIERHHQRFNKPPIGPIGSHLTLDNGDRWAPAVENAIGRLLNAFIVTNHSDSLLLRSYAREARYHNLQIIIYDFSRSRLVIPSNMLPQTNNPTTLSVLHSKNDTVLNVLVDMGGAERQVLVENYDAGSAVAFDKNILNVKEVYTLDGYKMFSRGSVQTVLPPNRRNRTGRLCSSYDDQIKDLEQDASNVRMKAEECRKRKRDIEANHQHLQHNLKKEKETCSSTERELASYKLARRDLKKSYAAESSLAPLSNVDELLEEISKLQGQIQEMETSLGMLQNKKDEAEAKASDLKLSFENLCESGKEEIDAFKEAEAKLTKIENDLQSAERDKAHYEEVMATKVVAVIKAAEAHYQELEGNRKENCRKASIICPECDIEALGGCDGRTPEQLSAQLNRLNQRLQQESQQYSDSIDDLRMLYEKKQRKILKKQQTYRGFREKLEACKKALDLRWNKFQRNSDLLKRQLTWKSFSF